MPRIRLIVCLMLCITGGAIVMSCDSSSSDRVYQSRESLESDQQKTSYVIGIKQGMQLKSMDESLDMEAFVQGVRDQYAQGTERAQTLLLPEDEVNTIFETFLKKQMERREQLRAIKSKTNLDQEKAFLIKNGKRDEVQTTDTGLQYLILKKTEGDRPEKDDAVVCHILGRFLDGREFINTYKTDEPAKFVLQELLPGQQEGVRLMSPGSKYRLFIPSALAYGKTGDPRGVEPNSTLIFDIELMSIIKANAASPTSHPAQTK